MLKHVCSFQVAAQRLRERVVSRLGSLGNEEGASTVEWVIITGFLIVLAAIVGRAIYAMVASPSAPLHVPDIKQGPGPRRSTAEGDVMPIRRRAHTGDETGASTIELLVFFPLLLLIVLLTVQLALSWYGNEVAMSTAREVARSVRSGGDAGVAYAHKVGAQALTDVDVNVSVTGDEATVTVSGKSMDIIAGFAPRVNASVTSELETFREDT